MKNEAHAILSALALAFVIPTAVRTDEVFGATWIKIDLDAHLRPAHP